MGRGGGSRAAGAIAHMEMGEVFKTAGFRRARGRARGSCGDADRDDARRAVKRVTFILGSGLVLDFPDGRCLELSESPDQSTSVTPVSPKVSLGDLEQCQLFA